MATMAAKTATHLEKLPSWNVGPSRLHNFRFLDPGWGAGQILRRMKIPTTTNCGERAGSGGSYEEVPSPSKIHSISPEVPENAELPWNLRRRKASSSKSVVGASGKAKRKFSVSLSFSEIEVDFFMMNGKKPNKRPKRRPRHVQKQVDPIFPGMDLHDVSPDQYKVE